MKAITLSLPFLFALLANASLDNLIDTRGINPEFRRFLPRGDVLIPPACYIRTHAPADIDVDVDKPLPTITRYESTSKETGTAVVDDDTSRVDDVDADEEDDEKLDTTAGATGTVSSSASASSSQSTSNGGTKEAGAKEGGIQAADVSSSASSSSSALSAVPVPPSTAIGGTSPTAGANIPPAPIINNGAGGPQIASNAAIAVVSTPTGVSGAATNKTYGSAAIQVNAKRSNHISHSRPQGHSGSEIFTGVEIERIPISSEVIVLDNYIDFDWTDWKNSICIIDTGDRDGWDEQFGCTTWGSFDGKLAFHAEADPCLQQRFADVMISYAKRFGGRQRKNWIKQIIKYRRHPRRVIKTLGIYPSSPYCLERPLNHELRGVWNVQLKGVDHGIYGGPNFELKAFGDIGTCPLSLKADTESCGCVRDPDFRWEVKHDTWNDDLKNCLHTCSSKYSPFRK